MSALLAVLSEIANWAAEDEQAQDEKAYEEKVKAWEKEIKKWDDRNQARKDRYDKYSSMASVIGAPKVIEGEYKPYSEEKPEYKQGSDAAWWSDVSGALDIVGNVNSMIGGDEEDNKYNTYKSTYESKTPTRTGYDGGYNTPYTSIPKKSSSLIKAPDYLSTPDYMKEIG